ncbi:MAG: late competence development ComFB family protein [Treponemataceae bacterium]
MNEAEGARRMEIHNVTEDIVLDAVNEIFDEIEREGKIDRPCTCFQCRLDTACYALNRSVPRYVVSSRGVARAETDSIEKQQEEADVVSLIHEGLQKIAKSKRPHFEHQGKREGPHLIEGPVYNFPTFVGRVFNGQNFEPLIDIDVFLLAEGRLAPMLDANFQNPYRLVSNTAGTFSFWPQPVRAVSIGLERKFEFAVAASAPGLEELKHHFEVTVTSEHQVSTSFSMERTFKLPDLYLFPPGGEEDN